MRLKRLSLVFIFSLIYIHASARPTHTKVELLQPDGSRITAILSGDEYFHTLTDLEGNNLVKGGDGFYRIGAIDPVEASIAEEKRARAAEIRSLALERVATKTQAVKKSACVVIMAEFSDYPFTCSRAQIERVFTEKGYSYKNATGSVADYFEDQLGGYYEFTFVVGPKVTLPKTRAEYTSNSQSALVVRDACQLAHDAGFDFSPYDLNGDGKVDNVFIVFSGKDQADSGEADAIWAYQWYLYSGGRIPLRLDGVQIDCFTMCSELSPRGNQYDVTAIGTPVHEFGHTLGLPDLYDADGSSSGGKSPGVYGTDVMDTGCYLNNCNTPAGYSAIEYDCLGIGEYFDLTLGEHTLEPFSTSRKLFKSQGSVDKEYFLFECKDGNKWNAYLKSKGLAVYHIDRSTNKVYGKTAASTWKNYAVNNCPDHMCAKLMAPVASCSSSAQAFFPYRTINSFSLASEMPFIYWNGDASPFALTDIAVNDDGSVSFNVRESSELLNPEIKNTSIDIFQSEVIITVELSSAEFDGAAFLVCADNETELKAKGNGIYRARLSELCSGTEYNASLTFALGSVKGEAHEICFKTAAQEPDGDPYIGVSKFDEGLPLSIMNNECLSSVKWSFNGKTIYPKSDGYYYPSASGLLKATIAYASGKKETLIKEVRL